MEEKMMLVSLYEVYKNMLTSHMQDIFEQYYYSDLSLREIASNKNISYQAVNDTLKKAGKQLLEYEKNIKAFEMKKDLLFLLENVSSKNVEIDKITKKYR